MGSKLTRGNCKGELIKPEQKKRKLRGEGKKKRNGQGKIGPASQEPAEGKKKKNVAWKKQKKSKADGECELGDGETLDGAMRKDKKPGGGEGNREGSWGDYGKRGKLRDRGTKKRKFTREEWGGGKFLRGTHRENIQRSFPGEIGRRKTR